MTRKRRIKPIGTIKAEKAACIKAFKKYPKATHAWCLHHEVLVEKIEGACDYKGLTGWRGRIAYIEDHKSWHELARRFRNFRPVTGKAVRLTWAKFKRQWPDNTWNGFSIFSGIRPLRVR